MLGGLRSAVPGAISDFDWASYFVAGTAFDNNVERALNARTYQTVWLINDYPSLRLIRVTGESDSPGTSAVQVLWMAIPANVPPGPALTSSVGAAVSGSPGSASGSNSSMVAARL